MAFSRLRFVAASTPHVDEAGVFPSHAGHFAVLEQTEQADLRFKGHLPDFIKKNGPVVRQLEFAGFPRRLAPVKEPSS